MSLTPVKAQMLFDCNVQLVALSDAEGVVFPEKVGGERFPSILFTKIQNISMLAVYLNALDAMISYRSISNGELFVPFDFRGLDIRWLMFGGAPLHLAINHAYVVHQGKIVVSEEGYPFMLCKVQQFAFDVSLLSQEKKATLKISSKVIDHINDCYNKVDCPNEVSDLYFEMNNWSYIKLEEAAEEALSLMPETMSVRGEELKGLVGSQFAIYDPFNKAWLFGEA